MENLNKSQNNKITIYSKTNNGKQKEIKEIYNELSKEKKGEWKQLPEPFDQYGFIKGEEQKTTIFRHNKM